MVKHIWESISVSTPSSLHEDDICIVCDCNRYIGPIGGKWIYIRNYNGGGPFNSPFDDKIEPPCTPSIIHLAHRYLEAQNG